MQVRLLVVVYFLSLVLSQTPPEQVQALDDLYTMTGGPSWTEKRDWNSGEPCSPEWYGITCSVSQITAINLTNNNLIGILPASLGILPLAYL